MLLIGQSQNSSLKQNAAYSIQWLILRPELTGVNLTYRIFFASVKSGSLAIFKRQNTRSWVKGDFCLGEPLLDTCNSFNSPLFPLPRGNASWKIASFEKMPPEKNYEIHVLVRHTYSEVAYCNYYDYMRLLEDLKCYVEITFIALLVILFSILSFFQMFNPV